MRGHCTVGLLTSLLALAGPLAGSLGAQGTAWGIHMRVTVDSGRGTPATTMEMTQLVLGSMVRMEMTAGELPLGAGITTLVDLHDSTITTLMASQQMAMKMPMRMMSGVTDLFRNSPVITHDSIEDLGPGPVIAGHPTRHLRLSYTGTMTIAPSSGGGCQRPIDAIQEMWYATDLAMDSTAAHVAEQMLGGGTGFSAAKERFRTKLPGGQALKTVSVARDVDASGAPTAVTTTSEVLEIGPRPADSTVFRVPASYQTMSMADVSAMGGGDVEAMVKSNLDEAAAAICAKRKKP